jgi:DNA-binding CsgD family transcriptional regulator
MGSRSVVAPGDSPSATVARLVRDLIERVADARADHDGVVLDVGVDGYRCVLFAPAEAQAERDVAPLSPREREIARMVAEGYPNKTIAAVLEISSWTVSTHLRRVFAKLGVRTRAAMVARALEEGLIADRSRDRP